MPHCNIMLTLDAVKSRAYWTELLLRADFMGKKVALKKSLQGGKDLRIITSGAERQEHAMNSLYQTKKRRKQRMWETDTPVTNCTMVCHTFIPPPITSEG